MNDPAMLLHIIQCHSESDPIEKYHENNANAKKTQLSKPTISKSGDNPFW